MYRLYPYNLWSVLPFIILSYPYFQPIFFFLFSLIKEKRFRLVPFFWLKRTLVRASTGRMNLWKKKNNNNNNKNDRFLVLRKQFITSGIIVNLKFRAVYFLKIRHSEIHYRFKIAASWKLLKTCKLYTILCRNSFCCCFCFFLAEFSFRHHTQQTLPL